MSITSTPEFHAAAGLFPLDEERLDELAQDIKQNRQQVPIELLDGKVIDGRRRLLACTRGGVKPKFRDVQVEDPIAYVLSLNLHRRHLSVSQMAMIGARAKEMYAQQAKERQRQAGGDKKSKTAKSVVEILPQPIPDAGAARDQAGKAVGVSGKAIDAAARVIEKGTPALIAAVEADQLSVFTAEKVASFSAAEQDALAERAKKGRRRKRPLGDRKEEPQPEPAPNGEIKLVGVGVIRANEAVDCLVRIPKNDPLRKRGFQIVKDWIKRNP